MQKTDKQQVTIIQPDTFEPTEHWYPKAHNAQIHPLVAYFLRMPVSGIITRYCHLNPRVSPDMLRQVLTYHPKFLLHAGADLFHVTDEQGNRKMVVIETNSCPSGQKSMPLLDESEEQGGYRQYIQETFAPAIKSKRPKLTGGLAVLYDKNPMEASGYAAAMADVFEEPVYFVPYYHWDQDPPARFTDGVLEVRDADNAWQPIRAAFRYVTQKPWNRLPVQTKTLILNPTLACLAGGRNKMMAAKAYDFFNAELQHSGLHIHTPETIWDVRKNQLSLWLAKLGGQAVIKVPYANAGQGVFTITSQAEFEAFLQQEFTYDLFIVQSLVGNYHWTSQTSQGRFYHVGTMPNNRNETYVADLRMMVHHTRRGLRPLSVYARRARKPLANELQSGADSWDMLGTNLSIDNKDGTFSSDASRLMMMDRKDFNRLGVSLDDLVEAYIQTVLSMIAIDKMAAQLMNQKGKFRARLFRSLNPDEALLSEIRAE